MILFEINKNVSNAEESFFYHTMSTIQIINNCGRQRWKVSLVNEMRLCSDLQPKFDRFVFSESLGFITCNESKYTLTL